MWCRNIFLSIVLVIWPILTEAQTEPQLTEKQQKIQFVERHEKSGRFSLFVSGAFFLRTTTQSNFQILGNPGLPGVLAFTRQTLLGYGGGGAVRISSRLKTGFDWTMLINGTKQSVGIGQKGPSRRLTAISWYVESTLVVDAPGRIFAQAGIGLYRFNFSDATFTFRSNTFGNVTGIYVGDKASTVGFHAGLGGDVWMSATDFGIVGFRSELKYHYIPTPDGIAFQGTKFSGFRFGVGFTFTR